MWKHGSIFCWDSNQTEWVVGGVNSADVAIVKLCIQRKYALNTHTHTRIHTYTHVDMRPAPYALIIHIPISAASYLYKKGECVILFLNIIIRCKKNAEKNV